MNPQRPARTTEEAAKAPPARKSSGLPLPPFLPGRAFALLDMFKTLMLPRPAAQLPSQRVRANRVALRRRYQRPQPVSASIRRFDPHQRVQHFLMFSSFIVLAATGLPQKFSGVEASQWWIGFLGGLDRVRMIHHIAGFTMLADCAYHVLYLFFRVGIQGKLEPLRMIPTVKDVQDATQSFAYFLGLSKEKPRFDRFSYLEKFDYWAVFWGICVIGTSGVLLMFAVTVTKVLPGDVIPLALTVHGDEAILAVGWIAVVHMFNAHLAPWVFPFNPAIFTGKLSREHYAEDHPLEYERMVLGEGKPVMRASEREAIAPIAAQTGPAGKAGASDSETMEEEPAPSTEI